MTDRGWEVESDAGPNALCTALPTQCMDTRSDQHGARAEGGYQCLA